MEEKMESGVIGGGGDKKVVGEGKDMKVVGGGAVEEVT